MKMAKRSRREYLPRTESLKILKRPVPLSDLNPLWTKTPSECTDEEYKAFYRKVFMDYKGAFILDSPEYGLSI